MVDAGEEMSIEVSCVRLPPLPSNAPTVVEFLRAGRSQISPNAAGAEVFGFELDGVAVAWMEYSRDAEDTKRPGAAPRRARSRCLIAANAWVHVALTGSWWEEDHEVAVRAWDGVVASLRLGDRLGREGREASPDAQRD